jgi:pimeloyl-ACP methyl ester carboxylesterase
VKRARQLLCTTVALTATAVASASGTTGDLPPPLHWSVVVDGHPLAVWERRPQGPRGVILLLHGRTWSALPDFDLQVPGEQRSVMNAFKERGFAAEALDLPGYGATARDASGWLTPDQAAEDVIAVLKRLIDVNPTLPRPVLLGWSNGARVAQLVAQRAPTLISALVLYGYPHDPAIIVPTSQTPPRPARIRNTTTDAASDFLSADIISQRAIEAYVQTAIKADPVRVDWRALEQWNALRPEDVHTPTLLIHGERDPSTPLAAQARLFTRLGAPDREWRILAGGDHAALIEDTQSAFIAAICEFIQAPAIGDPSLASVKPSGGSAGKRSEPSDPPH